MQLRSSRKAVSVLLVALTALASAAGAASCATNGAGENSVPDGGALDSTASGDDANTEASADSTIASDSSAADTSTAVDTSTTEDSPGDSSDGSVADTFVAPPCDANTTNDPNNCGTCGNVCPAPNGGTVPSIAQCVGSTCTFTCPADAGTVPCNADAGTPGCFDLNLTSSCGRCGYACMNSQLCFEGQCCAAGSTICGGTCTDITSDPNHCGSCDAGCSGVANQCAGGMCVGYVTTTPPPPANFVNACSLPGKRATLVNDSFWTASAAENLPFPFTFYGVAYTQVWLGSEGTLGFGPPSLSNPPDGFPPCTGTGDPTTGYPAAIAFGDTSLATGAQGVCFAETGGGDAGDGGTPEQFIITWNQTTEGNDFGSVLTFSIVLTKSTNTLDFVYETILGGGDAGLDPTVAGAAAAVGIQQGNGSTAGVVYSCNTTFIPSTPFDLRFSPAP
jgi:hypothetical protein